eukprot:SM000222S07005  [mRNA]  locus=s222:115032:115490:- [translate_table: standard]
MAAMPASAPPPVLRLLRQLLPPRPRARAAGSAAAAAPLPFHLRSAGPGGHSASLSCVLPSRPGLRQGLSDSLRLRIRCRASAHLRLHQASSTPPVGWRLTPSNSRTAASFPHDAQLELVIVLRGC